VFFANGHVSPYASEDKPGHTFKQRNQLLVNDGKGRFHDIKEALPAENVRVHRGAYFGDYDNDGKVDVLVTAQDDRPTLLRNESQAGNWLLVKLVDRNGGVTPIGAQGVAHIGAKKKMRVVLGGGSYAGESDHRLHFGLGEAPQIDRLEIRWPSGQQQTLENLAANQILTVREGQKPQIARTP
jgi:hypothetical protein